MKTRLHVSSLVLVALLSCVSCARPPFSLIDLHAGVSRVSHFDSEGNRTSSYESLSVFIESEEGANLQMEVLSPDALSTWLFPAEKKRVDNQDYYGKADLSLGQRMALPRGEWSLRVMRDDGRTITEQFTLESGDEPQDVHHHLEAEKGELTLDTRVRECSILLLDEKRDVLHRSTATGQTLDLTLLYPNWEKVRFVVLGWYDDPSKQSQIAWYTL